ncbi:hypothetical protein [Mucilaginibacter psychrotolerans]|uniref:Uncharacterized protein n=1 Tax=Mucilaginibacter psychrotolerans TaxID=1524096 RepID=A0A4Y8SBY6_9SPHI|nr:hypothetical protein [Mucilaginibacter psychrotolerans]TFF36110.1 hypothetical protein E2R66_16305 [Mucilaginibacter psychrotolerans]
MQKYFHIVIVVWLLGMCLSCKKGQAPAPDGGSIIDNGIYGDSVFYIQANGNTIKSLITDAGDYTSAPDGLRLDERTGEIDVNSSETGLKYKVTFSPDNGAAAITKTVIISGINYEDKIYNLAKGDSIAAPIYNADTKLALPAGNNNTFDQGGGCKKAGIDVNTANARINLAASVRSQGIDTGATQQVKLAYRLTDGSQSSLNGLEMKVYFYRTASEIPQYLTDLLAARKAQGFSVTSQQVAEHPAGISLFSIARVTSKPVKARPPCIIVVSR